MRVNLVNPENNRIKTVKLGISWVYLFFGGWALLFSGRWIYILIELGLELFTAVTGVGAMFLGIYHIFLFIWGNKMFVKYLMSKGWQPETDYDAEHIRRM